MVITDNTVLTIIPLENSFPSTPASSAQRMRGRWFEYHQKLHHSQTLLSLVFCQKWFEYHQKLHHSQTRIRAVIMAQ